MSICGNCGKEMKEKDRYCKECGSGRKPGDAFGDKKERIMNREKSWIKPALIGGMIAVLVVGGFLFRDFRAQRMGGHPMFAPQRDASVMNVNATVVTAQDGDVRIPVTSVEDGHAHFFSYDSSGKRVTFFVVKASDGTIRTAFDACVACNHAKLGYRQEGSMVICNNCGMAFSPTDIGKITGGCNPIPVAKDLDHAMIVLKAKDLEAGVQYF